MVDAQSTALDHTRLEKKDDNEECAGFRENCLVKPHIFQLLVSYKQNTWGQNDNWAAEEVR